MEVLCLRLESDCGEFYGKMLEDNQSRRGVAFSGVLLLFVYIVVANAMRISTRDIYFFACRGPLVHTENEVYAAHRRVTVVADTFMSLTLSRHRNSTDN